MSKSKAAMIICIAIPASTCCGVPAATTHYLAEGRVLEIRQGFDFIPPRVYSIVQFAPDSRPGELETVMCQRTQLMRQCKSLQIGKRFNFHYHPDPDYDFLMYLDSVEESAMTSHFPRVANR